MFNVSCLSLGVCFITSFWFRETMEIGAEQVQEDQIEQSFEETPPGKPLLGDEDPNVEVCLCLFFISLFSFFCFPHPSLFLSSKGDEHIPSETKKAKMSFADRVGLCLSWFRRAFESTTLNEWARHITLAACISFSSFLFSFLFFSFLFFCFVFPSALVSLHFCLLSNIVYSPFLPSPFLTILP